MAKTPFIKVENIDFNYKNLNTQYSIVKSQDINRFYVANRTKETSQYLPLVRSVSSGEAVDYYDVVFYSKESLISQANAIVINANTMINDSDFFLIWFANNFKEEKLTSALYEEKYLYKYSLKDYKYDTLGYYSTISARIDKAEIYLKDHLNKIYKNTRGFYPDYDQTRDKNFPWYRDVYIRYIEDISNTEKSYGHLEKIKQNEVCNPFLDVAQVMTWRNSSGDGVKSRDVEDGAPEECYRGQIVRVYGDASGYYICSEYNNEKKAWNLVKLEQGITCSENFYYNLEHSTKKPMTFALERNNNKIGLSYNGSLYKLVKNHIKFTEQAYIDIQISEAISYANQLKNLKITYDLSKINDKVYPDYFSIDFYYKGQLIGSTDKISQQFYENGILNLSQINSPITYKAFFSGGVFIGRYDTYGAIGDNKNGYVCSSWNNNWNSNINQLYGGNYRLSLYDAYNFLCENDIATLFSLNDNTISNIFIAPYFYPPEDDFSSGKYKVESSDSHYIGTDPGGRHVSAKCIATQDCFIYIQKQYDYTIKFNFYLSNTLLYSSNNITLSFDVPQGIELEWNDKDNSTLSTNIEIIKDSVVIPKIKLKLKGKNNYSYGKYYLYLLTSETEKKLIKTQDINFSKELDDDENLFYFNDLLASEYKVIDNYYTPYYLQVIAYTINNEEITTPFYKIAVTPDEISLPNNDTYVENNSIKNENQLLLTFNKNIATMNYSLKQTRNKYFIKNYYALSNNDSITLLFDEDWHPNGQKQNKFLIITFYDDMSFKKFSMYMSVLNNTSGNIYAFSIEDSHGIKVLDFESSNLPLTITFSFHPVENSNIEELIKMQFVNSHGIISHSIKVATRHTKLIKIRQNNNYQDQWEETCALTSIIQNYNDETINHLWDNSENSGEIRTIITFNNILKLESCEIYFNPISDDNISGEFVRYGDSVLNIIFTNNDRLEIYKNRILFFSENGITDKIIDNENANFIINNCKIHFNPLKIEIPQKNNIDLFNYYKNHYIDTIEIPSNNMYSNNQELGFVNTIKLQKNILGIQKNTTLENLYQIYDLSNFYNNQQYTNEIYNLLIEDYSIDYSGNKIINTIKNYIILNPDKNNFIQSLKTVIVPGHGYNFYIRACKKASRFDFKRTNLFYSIEPDPNYIGEYIRVIFLDEPKNTYSNYSLGDEFAFKCNIEQGALTQNFEKTALNNYSKYPKFSIGNKNYFTGSINCLLGDVKYREGETSEITEYRQSIDLPYAYYEEMDIYNKWLENIASGKSALIIDQKGRTFVSQITDNSINMFTSYGPKPSGISFSFTECDDFANIKILEVS